MKLKEERDLCRFIRQLKANEKRCGVLRGKIDEIYTKKDNKGLRIYKILNIILDLAEGNDRMPYQPKNEALTGYFYDRLEMEHQDEKLGVEIYKLLIQEGVIYQKDSNIFVLQDKEKMFKLFQ